MPIGNIMKYHGHSLCKTLGTLWIIMFIFLIIICTTSLGPCPCMYRKVLACLTRAFSEADSLISPLFATVRLHFFGVPFMPDKKGVAASGAKTKKVEGKKTK